MKRYGIERQTLLVTLLPILVMGILLEGYFLHTRFGDLENNLHEKSSLLVRQLAAACEYPVFSGNAILLRQTVESVMGFENVESVAVFDADSKLLIASGMRNSGITGKIPEGEPDIYEDNSILRLREDIFPTQINLDGLISSSQDARHIGAVILTVSKRKLQNEKSEFLLVSLLFTVMALVVALLLALRTARQLTMPVLQMHRAVKQIAGGDYDARVDSESHIDELNELTDGINEMAHHLQLDRDMLENRIEETTHGLREKSLEADKAREEKAQLNENLALTIRELHAIMEANPDLLYVFNVKGELVQWNSSFAQFCGLPPEKMRLMHFSDFICDEERAEAGKRIMEVYTRGTVTLEVNLVRHDGVKVPYFCNGVVLKNTRDEVTGFTGTGRDISERKAIMEQIHHMAHYDILTDLPNRALFSDRLQQSIVKSKRENRQFALMFLDLDMFKHVNDQHGHDVGDLLLKESAQRIRSCLRESDTPGRIGGDEFVVLLPAIESASEAMIVAEKIRLALEKSFAIGELQLRVSSSIGVAVYPEHGVDEITLMKNADTAMYQAKRKGRNTVALYDRYA